MRVQIATHITAMLDSMAPDQRALVLKRWKQFADKREWEASLAPHSAEDYPPGSPAFVSIRPSPELQLVVGVDRESIALRMISHIKPSAKKRASPDVSEQLPRVRMRM